MHHEKLQQYNVVWDTPSRDSSGSMPLGNGDIGINVWVEPNGDLLFYIAKTDAWNENARLLKLGRVRVSLSPNPFVDGNAFQQTLKLKEGEIEIITGGARYPITLRLWVDANQPVINVEAISEQQLDLRVAFECWRNHERELTGKEAASAYGLHGGPKPIIESPDTILDGDGITGRIVWFHCNPTSIWPDTLKLQGLEALTQEATDPLLNLTFGGVIRGDGLINESPAILKSDEARSRYLVRVYPHTQQTESLEGWIAALDEKIECIGRGDFDKSRQAHRDWWQQFWKRSWIYISGDEQAETVTRGYLLQRFITACAGRGAFPIKFNGSLFTVEAREEEEAFDADYRRWGGPYWFQNTRLAYWPMLASGDFEMMQSLFEMYLSALPLAQERTRVYFGHEGAFFPETMYFWGTYAGTNYGWERDGKPVSHVDNTYIRYYWSGALELIVLMQEYYRHTEDNTFLEDSLIPFADAVLRFYDQHYARDAAGKLFISPAQSLEMWQEADNPLPEIVGLQFVLEGLLELASEQAPACSISLWKRLQGELPPIPLRMEDGQLLIAAAEKKTDVSSNIENPELYAVFPYRIYGVGRADLKVGEDTFHARGEKRNQGWHQDLIQAAYLGMTEEAKAQISHRFAVKHDGSRFPGFWGPNYDWIPDQDHGCGAQIALQAMLLQTIGEEIHLFPAWPREWDVDFKLHASGQTVVEGRLVSGQICELVVTPESRKIDLRANSLNLES